MQQSKKRGLYYQRFFRKFNFDYNGENDSNNNIDDDNNNNNNNKQQQNNNNNDHIIQTKVILI